MHLVHSNLAHSRQPLARHHAPRQTGQSTTADLFDALLESDRTAPDSIPTMKHAADSRPHQNCYWVVPGALMAGEYPGAASDVTARARLAMIATAGVRHFVDLTEPHELEPYHLHLPVLSRGLDRPVAHERWSIRDVDVPHSTAHANHILDRIDALIAVKAVPYVHCWGGVGRTGTIIGCWLVRHGKSGEEALAAIAGHWTTMAKRARHPHSPETDAQRHYVLEWARRDRVRLGRV
jgi:hypothetical protein